MRTPSLAVLALPLLAPAALAGTITVGEVGAGADFTDLASAVAAAVAGDTIVVLPGTHPAGGPVAVTQPLTILGLGSDVSRIELAPGGGSGSIEPLRIEVPDPASTTRVVGIGIDFPDSMWTTDFGHTIEVANCPGAVVLQGIARFDPQNGTQRLTLRIENSAQVVVDGCTLQGRHFYSDCGSPAPAPVHPLVVAGSTVFVHDSQLLAGEPMDSCFIPPGAAGLRLEGSVVWMSDSYADGSGGMHTLSGGTDGHAGVELFGGSVLAAFGSTSVVGGDGNGGFAAVGVALGAGTVLAVTPDVVLTGGSFSPTEPVMPGVGGTAAATYTILSERWPTTTATPSLVSLDAPGFVLELAGEPGSVLLPFYGARTTAYPLPAVTGLAQLDPVGAGLLAPTVLGPAGSASSPLAVPVDPALVHASIDLQTFGASPSGALSLSNATSLTVLP